MTIISPARRNQEVVAAGVCRIAGSSLQDSRGEESARAERVHPPAPTIRSARFARGNQQADGLHNAASLHRPSPNLDRALLLSVLRTANAPGQVPEHACATPNPICIPRTASAAYREAQVTPVRAVPITQALIVDPEPPLWHNQAVKWAS